MKVLEQPVLWFKLVYYSKKHYLKNLDIIHLISCLSWNKRKKISGEKVTKGVSQEAKFLCTVLSGKACVTFLSLHYLLLVPGVMA